MIGTSKDGTFPIGNGNYGGIFITGESEHNEVLDNLIGGNTTGIYVSSSDNNILANNKIGTNEIEGTELGNEKNGI